MSSETILLLAVVAAAIAGVVVGLGRFPWFVAAIAGAVIGIAAVTVIFVEEGVFEDVAEEGGQTGAPFAVIAYALVGLVGYPVGRAGRSVLDRVRR